MRNNQPNESCWLGGVLMKSSGTIKLMLTLDVKYNVLEEMGRNWKVWTC